jgi:hypothetical protein
MPFGEIISMYSRVASDPDSNFHFHRGPRYAAEFLGYDAAELALLPSECTAFFAGVGNPWQLARWPPGNRSWTSVADLVWTCCWRAAESAAKDGLLA